MIICLQITMKKLDIHTCDNEYVNLSLNEMALDIIVFFGSSVDWIQNQLTLLICLNFLTKTRGLY